MSTPEEQTAAPTFEQRVNETVNSLVQGDDGKWQMPEIEDEALRYAVTAERRRRDTQSAYTKAQQEAARLKAENNHLAEGWQKDFASSLSPTVQAELEELKHVDPEAWRARLNTLEAERNAQFTETRTKISEKAKGESELEYRQRSLEEFAASNPDINLTDEVIANDLPPRFIKQLEKGEVSFAQFLSNAADYLKKGKVVKPKEEAVNSTPNLSAATGSSEPSEEAVRQQLSTTYIDEIY